MKIIKEGAIYFSASILEKTVPFLLLPFFTRLFSTEEYGIISIFTTVSAIYGVLIGTALNGFIRVIYHKVEKKEFVRYVGNTLVIYFLSLLLILCLTFMFSKDIMTLSGLRFELVFLAIVVASSSFVTNLRLVIFQTMRKPLSFAKLQLFKPVADLVLVGVLVFYLAGRSEERIFALVIASSFAGLIASISMYKDKLLNLNFDKNYSKRIMYFIAPLIPHSIVLMLVFTVDKLILSSNIGLSFVGEFSIALALSSPTLIITDAINRTFMPWSFEKFKEGKLDLIVAASYILLLVMFAICVLYSFILFILFDFIVGELFYKALYPSLILVFLGWLKLAYYLVAKSIVYSENTPYLSIISVGSGVIYLGIIFTSIKGITLIDISLYMINFHIMVFIGVFIVSQRTFPQPWYDLSGVKEVFTLFLNKYRNKLD